MIFLFIVFIVYAADFITNCVCTFVASFYNNKYFKMFKINQIKRNFFNNLFRLQIPLSCNVLYAHAHCDVMKLGHFVNIGTDYSYAIPNVNIRDSVRKELCCIC